MAWCSLFDFSSTVVGVCWMSMRETVIYTRCRTTIFIRVRYDVCGLLLVVQLICSAKGCDG